MRKSKAVIVLGIAVVAYLVAVMQRASMGVASIAADDRFGLTAAQLSTLTVFQLIVYAAMQIPVGILLDRWGSRRLIATGAIIMALGQFVVAISVELGTAVLGRMLVGLGDAFTFISLIRLINGWYSGRTAAVLQQWLANIGQLGQVLSAVPFALLLPVVGWDATFGSAAALSVLVAALAYLAIRDDRIAVSSARIHQTLAEAFEQLRLSVAHPGTRMAFWTHFTMQSSGATFVLLWGVPFLVRGLDRNQDFASAVLSSFVFIGIAGGGLLGYLTGRFPSRRIAIVTGIAISIISTWAFLLMWPGKVPDPLIWLVVVSIAIGGPASMIAFDFTREFVPKDRLGSANGFVNIGGFLATFVMMFVIGATLDAALAFRIGSNPAAELYDTQNFQFAMFSHLFVVVLGLSCFLVERVKVNRLLRAQKE